MPNWYMNYGFFKVNMVFRHTEKICVAMSSQSHLEARLHGKKQETAEITRGNLRDMPDIPFLMQTTSQRPAYMPDAPCGGTSHFFTKAQILAWPLILL